jgi:hypothetical protein
MNFYYLAQALNALVPDCAFGCGDTYDSIEWYSTNTQPLPTEQEVVEKDAELKYQEEVNVYQEKRKLEYPDWEDQLDKIYHDGIDAWKADIKVIKDKYPKQAMDATELQKRKDAAIFKLQKRDYEKAVARLAQYELSAGKKGVIRTENVWDMSTNSYVDRDVVGYIIEPLPLWVDGVGRNPEVVQDETERKTAQEIINKTPQAVIDSINT